MTLQKTFTDALISRLNAACEARECDEECEHIGWCGACWSASLIDKTGGDAHGNGSAD